MGAATAADGRRKEREEQRYLQSLTIELLTMVNVTVV